MKKNKQPEAKKLNNSNKLRKQHCKLCEYHSITTEMNRGDNHRKECEFRDKRKHPNCKLREIVLAWQKAQSDAQSYDRKFNRDNKDFVGELKKEMYLEDIKMCLKCKYHEQIYPRSEEHKEMCEFLYCPRKSCKIVDEKRETTKINATLGRQQKKTMKKSLLTRGCEVSECLDADSNSRDSGIAFSPNCSEYSSDSPKTVQQELNEDVEGMKILETQDQSKRSDDNMDLEIITDAGMEIDRCFSSLIDYDSEQSIDVDEITAQFFENSTNKKVASVAANCDGNNQML
jgi:DM DNA binding domain